MQFIMSLGNEFGACPLHIFYMWMLAYNESKVFGFANIKL